MYSVADYAAMVGDTVRNSAYREALRRLVRPGSVVADIGTGAGIFAILAAHYGARRVFAIEREDVIALAREDAARSGAGEVIEFIQARSDQIELPEPVDVVVSDLHGILPWWSNHIATISDARERFLAPGGRLVPQRDELRAALVEAPERFPDRTVRLDDQRELSFDALERRVANSMRQVRLSSEKLLCEPVHWLTLDYAEVDSPDFSAEIVLEATRSGTASGICIWFDAVLLEDVRFSNAPGGEATIYGQSHFPLAQPTEVSSRDVVTVRLSAKLVGDGYVWRWTSEIADNAGVVRARYEQSSLASTVLSPERLRRRQTGYRPALDAKGEATRAALMSMDGETSLSEIADRLFEQFPGHFEDAGEALRRVTRLSERYGR